MASWSSTCVLIPGEGVAFRGSKRDGCGGVLVSSAKPRADVDPVPEPKGEAGTVLTIGVFGGLTGELVSTAGFRMGPGVGICVSEPTGEAGLILSTAATGVINGELGLAAGSSVGAGVGVSEALKIKTGGSLFSSGSESAS